MDFSVNFNHQFASRTVKVKYEMPNRVLAPEIKPLQLISSKVFP